MIRRGFWLAVGAATGIYGYRRVSAIGRRLSASLNPGSLNPGSLNPGSLNPGSLNPAASEQAALARSAQSARRTAIRAARETYRFTRDVREGMDLYNARHSAAAGPTLSADPESTTHEPEDGH
jgi:hypothetical protein